MRTRFVAVSQRVLPLALVAFISVASRADDWPQWLGPKRDGIWRESKTVDTLPAGKQLPVRWRVPVAGGYAGPAVAGGKVFVTDFVQKAGGKSPDGVERVHCLDASNGKAIWTHEYPVRYGVGYGAGPRATPTVDGDRVYTLGAEGHLFCLDVGSGKPIWSKHFADDGTATPTWGFAAHPMVDGEKLICLSGPAPAGKLVTAFNKKTGAVLWTALKAKDIGYCPPTIVEAGGVRQLIIWDPESVNALDPETGKVYWSQPFGPVRYGVSIATPRFIKHPTQGDLLFISSSWDGSMVLKLDAKAPKASVLWSKSGKGRTTAGALHVLMAPPAVTPTHLFGISNGGELRCLDAATGQVVWETYAATTGEEFANWSTAFIVPNPTTEKSFIFNEHGDVILASLTSADYKELGRATVLKPTNTDAGRPVLWCHPALANGSVYWRNDREVVCVSMSQL